ncbi:DUF3558 family protein [Actinomycetospora sp. TBRC 11914]|uniref:DUF3558 family protein n=1 Tax=Actinomycetospora sp. TBRC 11914 TaxID=2729387 RepID=UPI00145E0931|nr:DUF3558 family protein [Actinomycetospora sp. TBRC 11914]NMO92216.1 DUF3558 family protein [Actinomycetospora sp. TBRC 11914]
MSARRAILAALLAGLCAGCATNPGSPAPSPSPRFGAPVVTAPRDVSAVAESPCASLLEPSELHQLGFSGPGRQRTSIDVQECSWSNADDEDLAMAVDADRDLLADTYRTRLSRIFVPVTVAGYPAVRQRMSDDDNTCTVTTGLGPRQALETEWSGLMTRQTSDPCTHAEEAIALVIRKLPPQK